MNKTIFYSTMLTIACLLSGNTQAAPATRVVNSDEPIVAACSAAITPKLKAAYGSQASLVLFTDKLTGYFVSNGGIEGLRGQGFVKNDKAGKTPKISFDCVFDGNNNKTTKASYKLTHSAEKPQPMTRVVDADDPMVTLCSTVLTKQIKTKYGSQASLVMFSDRLTGYFISNHGIEGLRGMGFVKNDKAGKTPKLTFDCVINANNHKANKASYKLSK